MGPHRFIVSTAVAFVIALAACGKHPAAPGPDLPARELRIARVGGPVPEADPFAAAWSQAREVVVSLLPQDVADPRLAAKGVETLRLRALHDGGRVAFLLVWSDASAEDLVDVDRSADAVAIELPVAGQEQGVPDSMMGQAGKPVSITFWQASWQRKVDGGGVGVDALFPQRTTDHYPPDAATDPDRRAELARLYEPPVAVGNPVAAKERATPVEDLTAEGFGTLTHAKTQISKGHGVHRDGRWHVVISRPLDIAPESPTDLRPGQNSYVAVAVWDGSRNERGSQKMRSIWVPLEVEGVRP